MDTYVLDCNIFDLLQSDTESIERIERVVALGKARMLVTRTVAEELHKSPFKGIPSFIPVEYTGNTVGRCGVMACGDSLGEGEVFYKHLGKSNKVNDALIADAASAETAWLVSQDSRLRRKLRRASAKCEAVSYAEFQTMLKQYGC